jgi:hypothetical protein
MKNLLDEPGDEDDGMGTESAEFLGDLGSGGSFGAALDPASEDALGGTDFDLFDPGFLGGSNERLLVDLVDSEEDLELASHTASELASAAQRHLSNPVKGTRKKAELVSFSEDDFEEGPQRDAFIIIKGYKNKLFGTASSAQERWAAIKWFFTADDDLLDPTFDLCCQAFGARIDVLRLRIHYEFFLRWWVAHVEFPFATVAVPELIDGEIAYIAGETGRDLAWAAWSRPGITKDELLAAVTNRSEGERLLDRLHEKLILCEQNSGYWYLTGRNPFLMRKRLSEAKGKSYAELGGSVHWSRLL